MPLSDREQQILSAIEARLREEDPKFAQTVGTTTVSSQARKRLKLSAAGFLLGLLLLFGIIAHIAWGIAGFALMLICAVQGLTQLGKLGADTTTRMGGQVRGGFNRYLDDRRAKED